MEDSARCSKHPRDRAGWICGSCGLELCVRCAARRKAGDGYVIVCLQCGNYAQPIMVPRARTAFSTAIADAFVFPFSRNGMLTMAAFGAVLSALELLGPAASAVALVLMLSYLFLVVRASSTGHLDLPESQDFNDLATVGVNLGKAMLVFVTGFAPCALYVLFVRSGPSATAFNDPITYILLALGLVWIPLGVLLATVSSPLATVLNPTLAVQCAKRLGNDYFVTVALILGCVGGSVFLHKTGAYFADVLNPLPQVISHIIADAATMYPMLVGGRILGMLLYVRGADIDYGTSVSHLEPALGGLLPPEEKGGPEMPAVAGAAAKTPATQPAQAAAVAAMLNGAAPPAAGAAKQPTTPPTPAASPAPPAASRPVPARPPAATPSMAPPSSTPATPSQPAVAPAKPLTTPPVSDWGAAPVPPAGSGWDAPVPSNPSPASQPPLDDKALVEAILGSMATAAPAPAPSASLPGMPDLPDLPPAPVMATPVLPPIPKTAMKPPGPPEQKTLVVTPPTDDEIVKLASTGDFQAVANAYRSRKGAVTGLDADQLVRTAEAAMSRSDLQTASHAFKRVGYDHPKSPKAPMALLSAARILRDLKKDLEGTKLLNHLVKSYPTSPEATEARTLLGRAA